MAYWATSALIKLYISEPDSLIFEALAGPDATITTSRVSRYEFKTVCMRREGEQHIAKSLAEQTWLLYCADIYSSRVLELPITPAVEAHFDSVLRGCLLASPPTFVRTNDALHIATALAAGEREFISADHRQKAAAVRCGLAVLP